ncbi:MAG: serine--tRNA ligase [Candidatus Yanofskybacteria bacterium RIFCSPLOWO2_02_FULL_43_10]|uniref:Serine--tRNA ligase n=1 Tax=Candidatus Yanofskybacteria bacterium RIFCSPLOWO2_12_FULL_43_11b TaxID=1802710 RepID=A0A1F8H9E6_9BACT|nr:MAG: serine--tRNA ligase [Candidatus Yanofskybacteria bacterium RIFCSPHIGHO2_01_FULL_43_32]OGN18366.1 MAG: serine--tRNA ligase [Candidatus Yanofskybacteria bacterium RIFCSPHIGHO2_12_FULL_43_11]OGN24223.1 MAG: serine--tRNA ligase [Candidatus Yanofskybacteria bacterium RIFCSPLOWO2_01_FULL_43_46]OGN30655.1 MAG: serine--tRNA ligase [Candidatus Yanofskybacteria bacterium RIFCSPLOWO2_02_FULL_43_10]OGN34184.1 MAG: serine--tRNA ligase [Candidatus Yanofskybacteria bacterium RIFCSPLOWO2_12_FULL_43_11b
MLDIKFIRNNQEKVREAIKNKNVDLDLDKLLAADERRRHLLSESEALKAEQNKRSKGPQSPVDLEELKALKEKKKLVENELACVEEDFGKLMSQVPNIPSEDTPVGPDESGNKILGQWGKIKNFDFKPKEHWELGESLDLIDSERAAKVSGARFTYLKRGLVLMEFAIIQYGLSVLTDEKLLKKIIKKSGLDIRLTPFIPILPPVFIKPDVFQKMARLEPKEERYHIPTDDLYLIGSAEHTMGSMHMDETFKEEDLPVRYVGFSTAFRREAGSYGKDMKGILRVHQFDKLEMESFCLPENSIKEQDFFVAIQEYFFQELNIPYQVVAICTGDMGGPDARQIDIEAWMPGQNRYRETHTADLMTDYQARRLGIKVKRAGGTEFVHMNDATALALSRTPIAIMENYQTKKGTIEIPKVLRKYMGGIKEIK